MGISSAHMHQSSDDDLHNYGKRLVEMLSGEAFKSGESRSYGENVLDERLIEQAHTADSTLKGVVGSIEYRFSAQIRFAGRSFSFGEEPSEAAFRYGGHVTILSGSRLENGLIEVEVWN
jgi:hypothetical protein